MTNNDAILLGFQGFPCNRELSSSTRSEFKAGLLSFRGSAISPYIFCDGAIVIVVLIEHVNGFKQSGLMHAIYIYANGPTPTDRNQL